MQLAKSTTMFVALFDEIFGSVIWRTVARGRLLVTLG